MVSWLKDSARLEKVGACLRTEYARIRRALGKAKRAIDHITDLYLDGGEMQSQSPGIEAETKSAGKKSQSIRGHIDACRWQCRALCAPASCVEVSMHVWCNFDQTRLHAWLSRGNATSATMEAMHVCPPASACASPSFPLRQDPQWLECAGLGRRIALLRGVVPSVCVSGGVACGGGGPGMQMCSHQPRFACMVEHEHVTHNNASHARQGTRSRVVGKQNTCLV